MKKLLHVVHYPVFGGPHNQALRLAAPLAARGFETVALLPNEPGNAVDRLRDGGVETVTMPLHRLRARPDPRLQARFLAGFPGEIAAIRRVIRERQIDVVLVCGLVNPHAAIAARMEGVPVVWQLVDTRPPMALRRLTMPLVTKLANVVMSTGVAVAEVHPGATSMGRRLVPFFPPVDTTEYRPDPARRMAARRELGVTDDRVLLGTVGNLNPQKGHEYLLRAAALVRDSGAPVSVRILGARTPTQDAYEQSLRTEARDLGLEDGSGPVFVEPGARVAELLPAFDVFVLSSVPRSEGVPTVILEAMACGIPVVATDVGAVQEVVEQGVTGYVVPPLNPRGLADALQPLVRDASRRTLLGETARSRAVDSYDVGACADVHVRAFELAARHLAWKAGKNLQARTAEPTRPSHGPLT